MVPTRGRRCSELKIRNLDVYYSRRQIQQRPRHSKFLAISLVIYAHDGISVCKLLLHRGETESLPLSSKDTISDTMTILRVPMPPAPIAAIPRKMYNIAGDLEKPHTRLPVTKIPIATSKHDLRPTARKRLHSARGPSKIKGILRTNICR